MIRLLGQLTGVAVIGSIWSARVIADAGAAPFGAAGSTTPAA